MLVTRPGARGAAFVARLRAVGVSALHVPAIVLTRLPSADRIAAAAIGRDAILITSPFALDLTLAAFEGHAGKPPLFVVGGASARRAREAGFPVLAAAPSGAGELVRRLASEGLAAGLKILWPCGDRAPRPALAATCPTVEPLVVYRNEDAYAAGATRLEADVVAGADVVGFWSPSAVEAWVAAITRLGLDPGAHRACAIGETTAIACREAGIDRITIARRPDDDAMLAAFLEGEPSR